MAATPNQFDLARQRAKENEGANLQGQRDALQRRQAQLGGNVSGALIKQEQVANDESAKRLQSANEGINSAEQVENQRVREIKEGRDFAANEAQKGRDFASGESALQRRYLTGEREAGQGFQEGILGKQQTFAAGEADKQRGFLTGERVAGQTFQEGMLGKQQDFARGEREASQGFTASENKLSREQQASQFDRQMGHDWNRFLHEKEVDAFNMDLAMKMFKKKDMLEQLFGNFSSENTFGKLAKGLQPMGESVGGGVSDFFTSILG